MYSKYVLHLSLYMKAVNFLSCYINSFCAREALLHASTSPRVETSSGINSLRWPSAEAMVESRRSACSALALRFCGVEPVMRPHRPQQHREPYCLRLGLSLYHLGRPIKGNWDTKTTRYTTTWFITRPETGLII